MATKHAGLSCREPQREALECGVSIPGAPAAPQSQQKQSDQGIPGMDRESRSNPPCSK